MARKPGDAAPFAPGEQVYHRLRWDERFDLDRCQIVVTLRPKGTKAIPFREFVPGGRIPWHRIVEFRLDGTTLWNRTERIDRLDEAALRTGYRREGSEAREVSPIETVPPLALEQISGTPMRFDSGSRAWSRAPAGAGHPAPAVFRVVTWNVLFDRFEAELLESARRWQHLLDDLEKSQADLIGLVEVTPAFLTLALSQPWVRQGYFVSDGPDGRTVTPHGQLLLSRWPIREVSFSTLAHHRRVLWARVVAGAREVNVALVHLASDRSRNPAETRAGELRRVLGHVGAAPAGQEGWIVMGDFNCAEDELDPLLRGADAVDSWRTVHPGVPGLTFDVARNSLAGLMSARMRSGRFDRIFLVPGAGWAPREAKLLGETPLLRSEGGLFPSDHFGLRVDLALQSAGPAGDRLARVAASRQTALVLLPPAELWGPLQRIRSRFDHGYLRWMPHVTLLYGFVDPAYLGLARQALQDLVGERSSFEVRFDRVERLEHASSTSLVLEPSGLGRKAILALRMVLASRFPQCMEAASGPVDAFRPHLTLARLPRRAGDEREVLEMAEGLSVEWPAASLALLRRDGSGPFEIVGEVELAGKRGKKPAPALPPSPVPVPAREAALALLRSEASLAAEQAGAGAVVVEPFGSALYAAALASDLDVLILARKGREDSRFARSLFEGLAAHGSMRPAGETESTMRARGALGATAVDLTVAFLDPALPLDVGLGWKEATSLAPDLVRALRGPLDGAALAARLRRHGRERAFSGLLPLVRRWVGAREILSTAFGYPGSFGWAMLLAIALLEDQRLCGLDADHALAGWFEWLASIEAGVELAFGLRSDGGEANRKGGRLRILTPVEPRTNVARSLTAGTEGILRWEFRRAAVLSRGTRTSAEALARVALVLEADPPPGCQLTFAVQMAGVTRDGGESQGAYQGGFLGLLEEWERALGPVLRPWGRIEQLPDGRWRHRIGIEEAGVGAQAKAIAEKWIARRFAGNPRPVVSTTASA